MAEDDSTPPADSEMPPPAPKAETPPWGDDFDAARAWKTIQTLRAREAELTPLAKKAKELEDAQKSETQRLTEERDALKAERDAVRTESLRLRIAAEKGLTPKQAARLRGSSEEELLADAEELLTEFQPAGPRRPTGDIDQGIKPGAPPEPEDPASLAAAVLAKRGY